MNNSGVVIKVEYMLIGGSSFTDMDIIPHSGKFDDTGERKNAGMVYNFQGAFTKAKISAENDIIMNAIAGRKAQFKITDGNGTVHLIGDSSYPARMVYSRNIGGQPGTFNGYRCTITRQSPTPNTITI